MKLLFLIMNYKKKFFINICGILEILIILGKYIMLLVFVMFYLLYK